LTKKNGKKSNAKCLWNHLGAFIVLFVCGQIFLKRFRMSSGRLCGFQNDKMPMRENTLFPFIPGDGRKYANLGTLDLAF
jgi:hypothetical protein